jgi:4-amino-4-deoxy-L-arabinose transferase-like glycosyltransferase
MTARAMDRKQSVTKPVSVSFLTYETVRRLISTHKAESLCLCLLVVMAANLLSSAWRETVTNDELVHIPAGYHYLVAGNFSLNPEHPPLLKMWACLPLLILRPKVYQLAERGDQDFAKFTVTSALEFWQANQLRSQAIVFWSRVPMVLLTLALGLLIFIYGRRLFGARAAILSLLMFSLEPTMLAHGWIVHTDIAAAFAYLLFLFALQAYYRKPTIYYGLLFGLTTAFALLTKFSLVILLPIFFGFLAFMILRAHRFGLSRVRMTIHSLLAAAILFGLINAAYFFQHPELAPADFNLVAQATTAFSAEHTSTAMGLVSKVLPTQYVFGLYTVYLHNHFGHPASLLGRYSDFGWWYYFPAAFALKTSLPFLLVSLGALAWGFWRAFAKRERRIIPLVVAILIYAGMSMSSNINIGVRHIAPIFPLLFLLSGTGLDQLLQRNRSRGVTVVIVILLSWMFVDAARAYPNYLSFTNSLTLGRPGWQVLSDSNVEWGQDIGALARYLHERGETELVGSLSGGWAAAELYEIRLLDFAPPDLEASSTRYVAVGVGFLNGSTVPPGLKDAQGQVLTEEQRRNYFAKYRSLEPEQVFGNSIYLYRARQ